MFWNQRKTACSSPSVRTLSAAPAPASRSTERCGFRVGFWALARPVSSSSNIWERWAGSGGGGANAGAGGAGASVLIGAPVGCSSRAGGGTFGGTGGGTGVSGSSGEEGTHPIFPKGPAVLVVMVAAGGGKTDTGEAGAQARSPPRPRVGTGAKSPLYLVFSASESAFQRWPSLQAARGGGFWLWEARDSACGTRAVWPVGELQGCAGRGGTRGAE
jgi:hypothetical protein